MNQFCSPPNHENRLHTIDTRLRASSESRWAGSQFRSPIRRGDVPSGAAAFIAIIKDELSWNIRFS
jgi:hypothetical protein